MSVEVVWFHHASFRLAGAGCTAYIDPWKIPSAPQDADVVFVSHSHYDHCSPDDIAKVSNADTAVIAPAETIAALGAASAVAPGERLTIKEITVEAVAAYNIGKKFHLREHNWCGAVFTLAGRRIYYSGDTDLIPEMSGLKDVDLALLPVGGTYTLNPKEAVEACKAIGCKAAIPYHWGDIVGSAADAAAFAQAAGCIVHVLKPGGRITI